MRTSWISNSETHFFSASTIRASVTGDDGRFIEEFLRSPLADDRAETFRNFAANF